MWFQNKNIFLNIDIKHSSDKTLVEYYDCNFTKLECDKDNNVSITLPNKIIIRLCNVLDSTIIGVSLCGLKFNDDNLLKILEYRTCKYLLTSLKDLEKFPSQLSLNCSKDGYYVLNLFHRNPFAIHLNTANTIPIKELPIIIIN